MALILFALYFFPAIAPPVANLTALQTVIAPAWVADPAGRGTWSLLYSCLFTLLLCVYTAIHLNVPPPNDTKLTFWLRKTKWVAIAIFGPELVVYTAFEQWFLAKKFMKAINEAAAKSKVEKNKTLPPEDRDPPSKSPFDMVYAHYAVMGGFAADVANLHNKLQRVTFTTQGILFLAKHGCFLEASRSFIQDKSKADTLAKGLVCFQVLWVVGQAIERKVAGYPITLLELHTIVHVVCVIVMYGLWIRKPLNVQDPTVVELRDRLDILAFILQTSSEVGQSFRGFECKRILGDKGNWDPIFLWYANLQPVSSKLKDTPSEVYPAPDTRTVDNNRVVTKYDMKTDIPNIVEEFTPSDNSRIVCKLISGQALSCGLGPSVSTQTSIQALENGRYDVKPRERVPQDRICEISLSQADINRLELTAKFITRVVELAKFDLGYVPKTVGTDLGVSTSLDEQSFEIEQFSNFSTPYQRRSDLLTLRAPNFNGSVLNNISKATAYLAMAMALIPTAYGCVHLGALSIIFPTPVERLLWKVSCYYLIATAGAFALFSLIIYACVLIDMVFWSLMWGRPISACSKWSKKAELRYLGSVSHIVEFILTYVILAVSSLILFLYVGARLYIVVESFISLRHVPIGVYQTPSSNIMGNIPHL